ncbi:MAG: DUF624 domain-containing protein [Lachnospiraceae bacterium]|nr:DUF624 domain-containing protein [Lachnospiraceae bacterium]
MGKLFNINNPFWTFMGKLVDVVVLHFVWLVCSIPIVTIGPATTALYYALLKDTRDEGAHYVRNFFKSFKENMRQGIILGLIMTVFGVLMGFSLYFYFFAMENVGILTTILKALSILVALIYLFILQYVFALLARFENTVKRTIQNAFLFSIRYIGWTILMIIILIVPVFIFFWFTFIPLLIPGYALVVFLDCYILNHIFKPYVSEQTGEEDDPDSWNIDESEYTFADSSYTPAFSKLLKDDEKKEEPAELPEESNNAEESTNE